ncbi:bifunctional aspartate kinase/diaminopimelate decarboxylase [Pseudolysobacter antarcticus]|uniref:Diaminopimelate decarboxylase n=1 Tax=Pseudolysobacter antarcticus TaxID=2511995 RepID=A0A411HPY2_9GAMM|nr:bifunctional aspartate kinase/diaminopimelate decarboxylase [Pseudolysobacter antarcticus]
MKFGGTSVSKRERWDNIRGIAAQHLARGKRVLIVVSALSGMTDKLKSIAESRGNSAAPALAHSEILARHAAMLAELDLAPEVLHDWLDQLDGLVNAPDRESVALSWQAQVLSLGELLSSTLGAAYLNASGLATNWLDARAHLRAEALPNQNAWGRYLSASVPTSPDAVFTSALAKQGEVFITQGFMARNADGETVILGRGGSDTSAAYFGALLKAEKVEIWTDVCGMFSANPRQVAAARLLGRLDYEEAQEIATTGAKVLHPRCLNPLREAQVPLLIKDTNRPELAGTEISIAPAHAAPSIKAISSRSGITLVSMESIGMWQQVGFLSDLFAIFKHHGLSIDLISTAETNVTVSLDPSENLLSSDVLSALCADLAQVCRVKVITPCAAITLVGRGIRSLMHKLSGVLAEFGSLRVHQLTQSSNNLNLTFVVDEDVAVGLVPRLHALLIKAEAMRISDPAVFGPSWRELYADNAAQTRALPWWMAKREALLALAAGDTPRYVYDRDNVRLQAQSLRAFGAVDEWFYAIKANPHPAVLAELVQQGFGLECVSLPELTAVRAAQPDLPLQKILFTPNFAPREEYAAARAMGVRITLDNLHPLAFWGDIFAGGEIILRVDLGVGRGHHDKVKTGGAQSKFGLSLDELPEFRRLAAQHGVRVVGLHAHLGSGILDHGHWREVYAQLASLAEPFGTVELLNIGGGLGVPARADETPLDLAAFGATLAEIKAAYPQYRLWLEPGRYLVADAGVLLARVTQLKRKGDFHYVGIDAGMNSLLRPALYEAYHEIVNLTRLDKPADTLYQVVGPICESGDVLGNNRCLPQTFEGDVLLIAQTGAYGAVMGSRYNLREPAAEIVL